MAKIRHLAIKTKSPERLAAFYEEVFDMKRLRTEPNGGPIYMSDGYITLALLRNRGEATPSGINHFGFQVDDLAETEKRIEANGGKFFFDLGDERHGNFERKFKDPDGVIFDISKHGWQGTDGYKK
jgi:predicted enzyme related to lactoylglutathione lyase